MQGSEKDLWWVVMRNPKLIGEMIAGCKLKKVELDVG